MFKPGRIAKVFMKGASSLGEEAAQRNLAQKFAQNNLDDQVRAATSFNPAASARLQQASDDYIEAFAKQQASDRAAALQQMELPEAIAYRAGRLGNRAGQAAGSVLMSGPGQMALSFAPMALMMGGGGGEMPPPPPPQQDPYYYAQYPGGF